MTGNRNRTLRMYSALGGLVVVGVIALFTALGHHPAPQPPSYNLSSPSRQPGGLSVVTPTDSPSAPPAASGTTYSNPAQGPAATPVCSPVAQSKTSATYRVVFTATSPAVVTGFQVSFWTPEGALLTTATITPRPLHLATGTSRSRTLTTTDPAVTAEPQQIDGQGNMQIGWACSVTSYTVAP